MPISGRLMTSSIRLPIHIDATMPQNRVGRSVITCGPGWMPWIIMAPIISAITALPGRPSVSIGMNEVCAPALLAASGSGDAFDRAVAEARGVARDLLLQHIGRERGQRRAAARQHAEQRAEPGAAQRRRPRQLDLVARRHQLRDALRQQRAALAAARQIGDDLADAEHADRQHRELDAVGELGEVEGEALRRGLPVGADQAEQQPEHDHGDRLDHRAMRQHHRRDQAEHHQREIFRRAERLSDAGKRRRQHRDHRRSPPCRRRTRPAPRPPAPRRRGPCAPSGGRRCRSPPTRFRPAGSPGSPRSSRRTARRRRCRPA